MYPPDKIVDEPHKHPSLRFPHGFHWQPGSIDTSNGRHHRRPVATKLHLDASIVPRTLPPYPPPPPSPRAMPYHVFLLEPKLRPEGYRKAHAKSPEHLSTALLAKMHGTTLATLKKQEESELSQRWPSTCPHLLLVASRTSVHNVVEHSALLSAGNTYY